MTTSLSERQNELLNAIIEEFVDTAQPIASQALVESRGFAWSSATVRNEMALLEKRGLITHPHTSAGRIPTERGWRHYLEHSIGRTRLKERESKALRKAAGQRDALQRTKDVAKAIAEYSQQTVIVGFTPHDVYYTGIANLMRHPEFQNMQLLEQMTALVDHCDEVIEQIFTEVEHEPVVLLGSENPFSGLAGSVLGKWGKRRESILCILGPIRMNYPENIARIRFTQAILA